MATREDVARLRTVPPTEFTATRNRLVVALRRAGRLADARVVARLRRPSAALWAVNRLARTDGSGVASFLDAVDRLRKAQLRNPRDVAEALRAQRAALQSLIGRAREVLTRSSIAASPATLRRISDTLMGAATDRDRASALRRGELTEELPAPGFDAFSGVGAVAAPLRIVSRREPPTEPPRSDDERKEARADAHRQRRALEADHLERQALEHQRSVEQLEAERAQAQARVTGLQKRLGPARRRARQAMEAARRARRKATR